VAIVGFFSGNTHLATGGTLCPTADVRISVLPCITSEKTPPLKKKTTPPHLSSSALSAAIFLVKGLPVWSACSWRLSNHDSTAR
jgi:hypothetical protein